MLPVFLLLLTFSGTTVSEKVRLDGAWQLKVASAEGEQTHILLFSGHYFSHTAYLAENGAFLYTKGGICRLDGSNLRVQYEFDTTDSTRVGTTEVWGFSHLDSGLWLKGGGHPGPWMALDADAASPLSGPWLFSGRERDGEISRRDTNQPRKTMKLLTGTRFQWIAYNTETKQFFGTGGGSYTAQEGVYTEHIEFFSRDNKRVGAQLEFEFRVDGADWHHRGKSSTGEPMYEIWSKRH